MKWWYLNSGLDRVLSRLSAFCGPQFRTQLTVLVVYSAAAVSVNVVTIVAGVTRQLQTLLRRRVGYVSASAGATGGPCLFNSGERSEVVALEELPAAEVTVALL